MSNDKITEIKIESINESRRIGNELLAIRRAEEYLRVRLGSNLRYESIASIFDQVRNGDTTIDLGRLDLKSIGLFGDVLTFCDFSIDVKVESEEFAIYILTPSLCYAVTDDDSIEFCSFNFSLKAQIIDGNVKLEEIIVD